jgi:hypothetical protein
MSQDQSPYTPPTVFDQAAGSPPSRPRRSLLAILAILGAVLLVPCLCCGVVVFFASRGISMAIVERGNIEIVVQSYLQEMENKNAAVAFRHFSPEAQQKTPLPELQKLLEGANYAIFSDYQTATVTNIQINTTPQRTAANVQGMVTYEGGVQGSFRATLHRIGDQWLIDGINVTVPPAKIAAEAK